MDCKDARRLADFARPGAAELDAAELAALQSHLADCPDCGPAHCLERRFDDRLARAMQFVAVPSHGLDQLLGRLAASRRTWWRNRLMALTAAVLGLTLLSALFVSWRRPMFDPAAIAHATYEHAGQWRSADEAHAIADAWLKGIDPRLAAPEEWNYKLLAFVGHSEFSGLSAVPTLVLTRGDAAARIYVVRSKALKNLDAFDAPIEDGGCTVAVRRYAETPGWAFIVVTAGAPLEMFLRPIPPRLPA
jgi:hypothetical protein